MGRATQRERELLRERVSASLPPPEEGQVDSLLFQKSRQEAIVSVSGSQEGMEIHGRINSGPHSSSLSPAGSSGWFESVIKGYSRTLCQLWKQVNVHTQTPPRWINCLELLAVHLALNRLKRRLRGEHVLVRTDSTATVAYINRQGGLRSRLHVATRPPPLESEASEVASHHSNSGLAQPDSR